MTPVVCLLLLFLLLLSALNVKHCCCCSSLPEVYGKAMICGRSAKKTECGLVNWASNGKDLREMEREDERKVHTIKVD